MLIRVNPKDGLPVYLQIMNQIKHLVVSGTLKPGDKLPAARELALELLININTVAKAYTELEREGVLERRRGSGTFVAESVAPSSASERARLLDPQLDQLVVQARQLGLTASAIADLLGQRWREVLGEEPE
jgi:GntR family transcriptional regulator